jgi:hypothetical protein
LTDLREQQRGDGRLVCKQALRCGIECRLICPNPEPGRCPGDTVMMEDVSGKGHRSRVKGAEEFISAIIPIK